MRTLARPRVHVRMVTPAARGSRKGNRVTAERWARFLRELGHRVTVTTDYDGAPCDVLVALHARRSYAAMARYRERWPEGPLVLALTGTDLYGDIHRDPDARRSLEWAQRLVVLQARGVDEVPERLRDRCRVIYQSVAPPRGLPRPAGGRFTVSVVGHLRPVKAPFLAAQAVRDLPRASRIRVLHAGAALEPEMGREAEAEMRRNPRYRWLGDLPRWRALRLMARSRLMVLSSRQEGGANVLSEAAVAGVPVLVSDIPGNRGMLDEDYPGVFPVDDAAALRELMLRCEREPAFLAGLRERMARLAPRFAPETERDAWGALVAELGPGTA